MKGIRDPGEEGKRRGPRGLRPYLEFVHLGTQMTLILLAGVFGGIWLDGKWGTDPLLTILGSLAGIVLGLSVVIRATGSGRRGS